MRLRIIDTNFTSNYDWLFKLIDENDNQYYIMDDAFYKRHNCKSPITKNELDYYEKGQWIAASVINLEERKIVIGA